MFGTFLSIFLMACSIMVQRSPGSVNEERGLPQKIQEIDLRLVQLSNEEDLLKRQFEYKKVLDKTGAQISHRMIQERKNLSEKILQLREERQALQKKLSQDLRSKNWTGFGPLIETQAYSTPGKKKEVWAIENLAGFEIQRKASSPAFAFDTQDLESYRLELKNDLPSGSASLQGRLECDGPVLSEKHFLGFQWEKTVSAYEFTWQQRDDLNEKVVVGFAPSVRQCRLLFKPQGATGWTHQFQLLSLDQILSTGSLLNHHLEVCARPTGFQEEDPVAFFWRQDFNNVTCARPFEKLQPLRDPIQAFNAKIKGLTGSEVPARAYQEKDPMVKLDFSKAPDLDFIWVSSLNFSADFYGSVLAQALRYHADQGVQIRILLSEATTFAKDKKLLKNLQLGRPNVKIHFYKFNYKGEPEGTIIDNFHRINHSKLLIGYSEKNSQDNFMITGGRNIRDPYLFYEKPEYSKYPWLFNYVRGERPFIYYDDFEIEMKGREIVQPILSQMMQLWNLDEQRKILRSTNVNADRPLTSGQISDLYSLARQRPYVRHFLSVPYVDHQQLEKLYVQMLDSAKKEILLTTPYFNPTEEIGEALDRARQRGVRIQILTGLQLAGDDNPPLVADANKKGINQYLQKLDIFEWIGDKSIMHAKLLVVDETLSFIGSVNLNSRSFLHDVESGVLILHTGTAEKMKMEVAKYFQKSQKLTQKKKIQWFNSPMVDWLNSYF